MSSLIIPDVHRDPDLKIIGLSVILLAMLYGNVVTLALTYIPLLLKTSHMISQHMCNFLLAYVMFMVTVSAVYMIMLIIGFTIGHNILDPFSILSVFNVLDFLNGIVGSFCLAFTSWGANGLW